ncbi:MAG: nucleotidyl transferase AbiEii/AbiGii toxin family protein [Candidatus Omnitrophica bacterium]|nr:nucleotidyl transferase AbiEii/AbiGii toxin family protein [Candidatus Omnitrophota bacterium]
MNGKKKEPLTELQQKIINTFKKLEEAKEFYFTGGSALAFYYLHHRISEDVDFFTSTEDMIQIVSKKLENALKKQNIQIDTIRNFKSFVELIAKTQKETTKIHISLDSPYKIEKPVEKSQNFKVDSLIDMAIGKLLALFVRAEERDFIDIYFLVKKGYFTLEQLIEKAFIKDPDLDKYYLAIAFEQVRNIPDKIEDLKLNLLKPLDIKELKKMFIDQAVKLLSEIEK